MLILAWSHVIQTSARIRNRGQVATLIPPHLLHVVLVVFVTSDFGEFDLVSGVLVFHFIIEIVFGPADYVYGVVGVAAQPKI